VSEAAAGHGLSADGYGELLATRHALAQKLASADAEIGLLEAKTVQMRAAVAAVQDPDLRTHMEQLLSSSAAMTEACRSLVAKLHAEHDPTLAAMDVLLAGGPAQGTA
jgi:hypothetical protein